MMTRMISTPLKPPIYLDYNATAPLRPQVAQAMQHGMTLVGNPSSIHGFGRNVRKEIEAAREKIAALVGADAVDVTFTSGATEANNTVIFGAPVKRVLCSAIEHPSVLDAVKRCADYMIIPVLPDGIVDLEKLEEMLAQNQAQNLAPVLVSVMWVNNETGIIQPVKEIAQIVRKYDGLFHCDAVQAIGRVKVDLRDVAIDYLTFSAHKIGGPSGIGALVYGQHTALGKMIHGGGQERRRRAGTENILGILGFAAAAECAAQELSFVDKLVALRDDLEQEMVKHVPQVHIIGKDSPRVANTIQLIFPKAAAEKQLMALDLAGIAVSSGSACSSGSIKPSHVLLAMGIPEERARCAIRVSAGFATTKQDMDMFLDVWVAISQRFV